eukprot:13146960-Heterocapsa_arctica.AAC.1
MGAASSELAPRSGEITGVLKQRPDSTATYLYDGTEAEERASEIDSGDLDDNRIAAVTAQIGEGGVTLVAMKADPGDTAKTPEQDKEFLAELTKGCSRKST